MARINFQVFRLSFPSGLHINTGKAHYEKGESMVHSDTFVAAIMATMGKWGMPVNEEHVVVSSLFPWATVQGSIKYFLPVPFLPPAKQGQDPSESKKWKKVRWMESGLWSKLSNGEKELNATPVGSFLSVPPLQDSPVKKGLRLRTRVNRTDDEDTKPYYIDELHFVKDAGLYFVCSLAEDDYNTLQNVLDLLQEEGLGSDRNVGKGHFTYETDTLTLEVPDQADYGMALGMYCPTSAEELHASLDENCSYQLKRRGGWLSMLGSPSLRKNDIYMFAEGSVFKVQGLREPRVMGKVVNLKPGIPTGLDHPIYRSGRSLFLPVKIQ